MRKKLIAAAVAAAAIVTAAGSAAAITNGDLDGEDHPEVVLILMEVEGVPMYRCTGTMIAPTFVLTAGHCAGAPGEFSGMRIFTESDVQNGDNDYPLSGSNSIEAERWAAHPEYPNAPFYFNDVGMIELVEPFDPDGEFPELPEVDQLDQLARTRGRQNVTFTAVGYGLQQINPVFVQGERVRMVAHPKLDAINAPGFTGDFSLLLSNNHSTGGTCFGDSGGPNFLGDSDVIAGVTSFGLNGTCGGTGGVFRLDRQNVQDFIEEFMAD
jgi:secreted trypsin-like serine protease